jgi:hypothetical protein
MGKENKNDFDATGGGAKKDPRTNRVPLNVEMAWMLHEN